MEIWCRRSSISVDDIQACKDKNEFISWEELSSSFHLEFLEVSEFIFKSRLFQGSSLKRRNEGQEGESRNRDNFRKKTHESDSNNIKSTNKFSPMARPRDEKSKSKMNCGQGSHEAKNCVFKGHPEYNAGTYRNPIIKWDGSQAEKADKEKYSSNHFRAGFLSVTI